MSVKFRAASISALVAVLMACMTTVASPANAISTPPSFSFTTYAKGIKFNWTRVSGAAKYQLKVRKTSQSSTSGTVFTLPSSRNYFRLTKAKFPAYTTKGAYRFTLCAVDSSGRRACVSQSKAANKTGTSVRSYETTEGAKRGASKANKCLADSMDAAIVTAAGTSVVNIIPGAGQIGYGTILAVTTATAGAQYVVCVWRSRTDSFATDDYRYVTSTTGSWGGGGGGGGGGGSWRIR